MNRAKYTGNKVLGSFRFKESWNNSDHGGAEHDNRTNLIAGTLGKLF